MNRQLIVNRLVEEEYERCCRLFNELKIASRRLPRGSLTNRDGQLCRFVRENGKQYLVPILNDEKLIDELRQRRAIKESLPEVRHRMEACKSFIDKQQLYDPHVVEKGLPLHYQGYNKNQFLLAGDFDVETWKNAEYHTNPMAFEEEHYTSMGVQCRSKSEALIGTRLEQLGIPYRYEVKIDLPWRTVYADFELLQERVRRTSVIEHFGMMDDLRYAQDSFDKIQAYTAGGFLLGYDFFFTSETRRKPLNIKQIDKKIDEIMKWNHI